MCIQRGYLKKIYTCNRDHRNQTSQAGGEREAEVRKLGPNRRAQRRELCAQQHNVTY